MRILFANHVPKYYVKDRDPLGIMCLSAVLRQAGHETRFCFPHLKEADAIIRDWQPDILAYSVATGHHHFYLKFNREIKKRFPRLLSVFGGPHPTFSPENIMADESVDALCRGEGDWSFLNFVNRLSQNGNHATTPGFWVRANGVVHRNALAPLVEDLDALPLPDRTILYDVYAPAREIGVKNFLTMRGCPYHCTYCFNHQYHALYADTCKMVRRRSVASVIEEIKAVAEHYPLQLVYFRDDNFVLFPDWVREFSGHYRREIGLPFVCAGRLNLITDDVVRDLRNAGCVSIEVGIEAGSDHVRNEILKRDMSREQIESGIRRLRKAGIRVLSENLIAVPGSTLADDLETYRLNLKCRVDYPNSAILKPYEGTDIYEYAKQEKLLRKDPSTIGTHSFLDGVTTVDVPHARQRARLNKVMALGVCLRLPASVVKVLVFLPLMPLYTLLYVMIKGYAGTRLYPFRTTLGEKIRLLAVTFKQHLYE